MQKKPAEAPESRLPAQPDHAWKIGCDGMSVRGAPVAGELRPALPLNSNWYPDFTSTACRHVKMSSTPDRSPCLPSGKGVLSGEIFESASEGHFSFVVTYSSRFRDRAFAGRIRMGGARKRCGSQKPSGDPATGSSCGEGGPGSEGRGGRATGPRGMWTPAGPMGNP